MASGGAELSPVATIAINTLVLAVTLWRAGDGGLTLGRGHVLAAVLAWVSFWIWIAMLIFLRRRHQRTTY